MTTLQRILLATLGLTFPLLAGCREAAAAPTSAAAARDRLCLVVLIDRSASYQDFEQAKRLAVASASQLSPGDSILVRWISDESYRHTELVLDRRIPEIESSASHVADRNGRRRARAEAQRAAATTHAVIRTLLDLSPRPASYTDVWGSLLASQEWLEASPCDRSTFVIVSDLRHNRGVLPELELPGVRVLVAGFEHTADVRAVQEIRQKARRCLEKAGAHLQFLPPGRLPRLRGADERGD